MGLCFRKSISIFPGVKLNLSKSGVSVSGGVKGLRKTVNLGTGKQTSTVGIPGTGVYYRTSSSGSKKNKDGLFGLGSSSDKKDSGDEKKVATTSNSSNEEAVSAVEEYNQYINDLKSVHKMSDGSINWNEASSNDELKEYAPGVLAGDIDTYLRVIEAIKPFDDLLDFGSGFEAGTDRRDAIEIEFSVKSKDVIPDKELSLTSTGKLSEKAMSKSEYYDLLLDYCSSVVIRVARDTIALLPVNEVLINAVDTVTNSATGFDEEITIMSARITRQQLESVNMDRIDPSDALKAFGCKVSFKKTSGFEAVERMTL